jgi:IrrE N-terminal-like domain
VRRVRLCIGHLERFAESYGVPVVRNCLATGVLGRLEQRRIVLRAGLNPEQQLLTLVHELTHLIFHKDACPQINRTVCEYEAEAVERWVGAELGVGAHAEGAFDPATVTDDLLACSVIRVRRAALMLLSIARGSALQSQPAIKFQATAGKEVIFHDELRGVRDLIGLA